MLSSRARACFQVQRDMVLERQRKSQDECAELQIIMEAANEELHELALKEEALRSDVFFDTITPSPRTCQVLQDTWDAMNHCSKTGKEKFAETERLLMVRLCLGCLSSMIKRGSYTASVVVCCRARSSELEHALAAVARIWG